jgi:microsomal epoxide hydrolase
MDMLRVAALFANLMEGLGYNRWGAQGGDWGAGVSTALGGAFADRVAGIHLNMLIGVRPPAGDAASLSEQDRSLVAKMNEFRREETAYMQLQGTKPQTVGHALNDSPAGLASWIVEKFRTWSDCGGDIEKRFTKDQLLTNILSIGLRNHQLVDAPVLRDLHSPLLRSAFGSVRQQQRRRQSATRHGPDRRCQFPGEIYRPPRAWAGRRTTSRIGRHARRFSAMEA